MAVPPFINLDVPRLCGPVEARRGFDDVPAPGKSPGGIENLRAIWYAVFAQNAGHICRNVHITPKTALFGTVVTRNAKQLSPQQIL